MPEDYIIQARGVHKTYDLGKIKVPALRGIDLAIKKGEMVAIMGPSGCGKTTLLNCLPMLVSGIKPNAARLRAKETLALVGLSEWADRRPGELSGGQRQRVTIARALVNQPAIVWGDEPTGDLDSETAQDIMDLLCRLNKENGQTFVLVTHSLEVGQRGDRIIRMRDGCIMSEGN